MSERIVALVGCAVLACLTSTALGQPSDAKKDEKAEKFSAPPAGFDTRRDGIDRGKLAFREPEQDKAAPAVNQNGPTIKDVYKNHFLIGMAGDIPGNYSDVEMGLVTGHFNAVTPENCMKPGPVHPSEETWSFARPDALVKWCGENGHATVAAGPPGPGRRLCEVVRHLHQTQGRVGARDVLGPQ